MSVLEQKGPGLYESHHVSLPYSVQLPGLHPGSDILVVGKTHDHAKGFSVNLCVGPNMDHDIALHYNPRLEHHKVVSNSKQGGNWGGEEIDTHIPFGKDQHFEIRIKVTQQGYEVLVNNSSAHNFHHRIPFDRVSHLFISGDISVKQVQFSTGQSGGYGGQPASYGNQPQYPGYNYQPQPTSYNYQPQPGAYGAAPPAGGYGGQPGGYGGQPQPYGYPPQSSGYGYTQPGAPIVNPPVPFNSPIPGGLNPGKMIFVSGVANPNCQSFTINFVTGPSDQSDIALHFNVRVATANDRNVVVRTHRRSNAWGQEERQAPYFPFTPGSNFDLTFLVEPNSYKIAVNNSHYVEFNHRIPIHEVNHLQVHGDVRLNSIRFQ